MKAVCIHYPSKNMLLYRLTQGKAYEVIDTLIQTYKIINDDGKQRWYHKSMFMPLEEWRERQLNEILKEEEE